MHVIPLGAWKWPRVSGYEAVTKPQLQNGQARSSRCPAPLPLSLFSLTPWLKLLPSFPFFTTSPALGRLGGAGLALCAPGFVWGLRQGKVVPLARSGASAEGHRPQEL